MTVWGGLIARDAARMAGGPIPGGGGGVPLASILAPLLIPYGIHAPERDPQFRRWLRRRCAVAEFTCRGALVDVTARRGNAAGLGVSVGGRGCVVVTAEGVELLPWSAVGVAGAWLPVGVESLPELVP